MWKMLWTVLGLAAISVSALVFGSRSWKSATKDMHDKLEAARLPGGSKIYSAIESIGLPAPVQRYFRAVLPDESPMVLAVSLEHTGTFNMSQTGEQWKPFTSTQRVITQRPGFDWEARIVMIPGLTVRVHDAYIAGEGILHASLFGLISMANLSGTPEIAQGELMRFLAEAAMYPTALLPREGMQWEAVDATSAKATMNDDESTVALLFCFSENGLIESVRAEGRGRIEAGAVIPTPWEVRLSNYEVRGGMLIPISGEVAWILPDGPRAYWRGRITKIRYEFA